MNCVASNKRVFRVIRPGDYGSMVNEVVGTGDWDDSESLGETWRGRNVFSYGRNEGGIGSSGTARPAVLDKLLATTERVVQEIDSVEYGLTDIQGTTKDWYCPVLQRSPNIANPFGFTFVLKNTTRTLEVRA